MRTRNKTSGSSQKTPPFPAGGRGRGTQATQNASNNKQSLITTDPVTTDPITTDVKLFCLVHGDDPTNQAFKVEVAKGADIADLKKLIKKENSPELDSIAAHNLTLWLVNIHEDDLITLGCYFDIGTYGPKLSPFRKIQDVFPEDPAENHVHVIVELPPALKRSPSPTQQHMTKSTDQVDKSLANTPPNTPPSSTVDVNVVKSTPVRQTTASSLTSKTRKSIDSLLENELEGILHRDIPEFVDKFFGSRRVDPSVVDKIKRMLRTYPKDGASEYNFYGSFIRLVNAISSNSSRSKLIRHDKRPLKGGDALRKPDLLGVDGTLEITLPLNWCDIGFVVEFKPKLDMDSHKTDIQLASYAREVFGAQPSRRFVLGFTVCCTRMRLWLFDRSGGISSEMFDIKEETVKFVRVISGLINKNEIELGYDPTIKMPSAVESKNDNALGLIDIKRLDNTECFVLVAVVFSRPVISGRATTVWKAFKKGENPRKYYAIKDSWRDLTHGSEGVMLENVTSQLLSDYVYPLRVAEYYHHEDLKIKGKDDDILVNIRKNLGPTPSVNRVHSRIILSTYGNTISEFSNNQQLLQVLRDAIEGHHRLWMANVLHRDISINNILIDDNGRGFIIDLDFAVYITRSKKSQSVHRTGTGPFMAIDVLREQNHDYRHDVESFFYVLLWICSEFERPGKLRKTAKKGEQRLSEWWKGTFEAIALRKITDMLWDFDKVLKTFSSSFEELKDCALKFHKLLFPSNHSTSSDIDYDKVIGVFDEALRMFEVTGRVGQMGLSETKTRRS